MANIKQFTIQINGVQESISAVESLNNQLNALEARINALASKQVNISTKSSNSTSALNEEEKLVKQIQQTEEKIKATRTESYQQLLAEKDLLKEAVNDQKERAAQERLVAGAYSNTMRGLKEELADIKSVMQTTDLGDEKFKDLVGRASQLTDKLKELEAQYGQFGRNVGNYASAAEGFGKFTVKVGDTIREFSSAREAARQLRQELLSLGDDAKGIDDLKKAINTVDSAIKDATVSSQAMDEALDMAQSFLSMAQAGQGLSAFFGLEGTGVEETIKNLVALQNALNGIEKIAKQMNSNEGLFKYFGKANTAIDSFTKKLFGVRDTTKEATTATKQQATATTQLANASNAATTAEKAQTTATAGLTVGMRAATVAAKALSMALKAIGIGILLEVVSVALEGIKSLASSIASAFDTASKQVDVLNMEFEALKSNYAYLIEENNRLYSQGSLSYMDYMTNQLKIQNDYISQQIELQRELNQINGNDNKLHWYTIAGSQGTNFGERIGQGTTFAVRDFLDDFSYTVDNLEEAKKAFEELNTAVRNGNDYWSEYGSGLSDWVNSLTLTVNDTRELMDKVGEGIAYDFVARVEEASKEYTSAMEDLKNGVNGASDRVENAKKVIKELEKEMNSQGVTHSILANLAEYIPDEETRKKVQSIIDIIKALKAEMNADELKNIQNIKDAFEGLRQMLMSDVERAYDKIDKEEQAALSAITGYTAEAENARIAIRVTAQLKRKKLREDEQKKELEAQERAQRESQSKATAYSRRMNEIYQTMFNLRLKMMKDGLNKRLIQLDEERRQTLTKLKSNQEAYLDAEKIFEERRKELIISAREELSKELAKLEEKNYTDRISIQKQQIQNEIDNYTYLLSTFGEPPTATVTPRYNIISSTTTTVKESLDDMYLEAVKVNNKTMVVENDYVSHLSKNLNDRIELFNHYVHYIDTLQEKRIDEKYKLLRESLDLEKQEQERANEKEYQTQLAHYTEMIEQYKETLAEFDKLRDNEGKFINEEYEKEYNQTKQDLERLYELQANSYLVYVNTIANIQRESQIKSKKLDQDELKEKSAAEEKKYNYFISQYRNFLSDLNAASSSQPVLNQWGIVNVSKTKKNYEEIRKTALRTLEDIKLAIEAIDEAVGNNILDEDAGKALKSQLRDIGNAASETAIEVQVKMSELGTELWKTINEWIQHVGQAATQIMSSLSEITSNQYEEQISQQEKYIEEYEKLLDKQKDKTQEYADAVKDIEGELADARGDRRQQLVDALNAEMAAQRASLAEEKRIEKEKEKAERRKSELEYNQAIAEKRMSVAQAALNAVMAVSMAAVNKYPIPAIPMMALAAAVGAAQVAAAKSQYIPKPSYGDGGVIQGRSHKEGGVPVLGGQAEVEGGEFITNKVTTSKNVDLLEFINSKRKKVDISDLLDFYNSGRPAKNISSIRTKFADGGVIPSLRSDIELSDRMYQAMEDYANRPTYVQVVDIIDRTERLNEVKVISGLEV